MARIGPPSRGGRPPPGSRRGRRTPPQSVIRRAPSEPALGPLRRVATPVTSMNLSRASFSLLPEAIMRCVSNLASMGAAMPSSFDRPRMTWFLSLITAAQRQLLPSVRSASDGVPARCPAEAGPPERARGSARRASGPPRDVREEPALSAPTEVSRKGLRAGVAQAVAMLAVGIIAVAIGHREMTSLRSEERRPEEFMAFYTVGRMLNESSYGLYDSTEFLKQYDRLFPRESGGAPLYAHAPFEALAFRPFAYLPFKVALVAWQFASIALVSAGFALIWRSGTALPRSSLPLALVLALSFQPISVALIFNGQVSALVFFWLALALWLDRRGREYGAGAALSLCLAKPTLLILLLPMLAIGRRWRAIGGFLAGSVVLAGVSLLLIGWQGNVDYVLTLLRFGRVTAASDEAFSPPSLYVDLNSFTRMLTGWPGPVSLLVVAVIGAMLVPLLVSVWRRAPQGWTRGWALTWASTITWTTLLNIYVPRYDTTIVVLGALLMVEALLATGPGGLRVLPQVLFAVMYVVAWIEPVPVKGGLLQPYTVVLAALGVHQLWLARRAARMEQQSSS